MSKTMTKHNIQIQQYVKSYKSSRVSLISLFKEGTAEIVNSTSFIFISTSFIFNSTSFIFISTSFIFNSTSFIFNWASFIFNSTSFIFNWASFIFNSTSFIFISTSFISPFIITNDFISTSSQHHCYVDRCISLALVLFVEFIFSVSYV
ncbi:UPF0612_protein [Hexamita inflata]|uniref:UPF0612_protein n=1 Tax=Hexamita inflata TaxID=28002 RepID=A0ABP1GHI6_9EUKA